ncbi:hypothetical protein [Aquimarina sp. 2201CG5-10]|uniref:hypothetical protein n=1 Tax=Aquimarina callyspongiae TaxID=3098150 RepID=UPI002AB598FA|nr:hypothetical protein [Aquimarina sp. 2201CG5-10]MDY8138305.1 hypothetical protein [Aquimarina sp. 2201CG5-10]
MKKLNKPLILFMFLSTLCLQAQESENTDYIEFNDRKNIVHGVYLGFNTAYGKIDGKDTGIFGLKVAYVANRKFEAGFSVKGLYSQQNLTRNTISNNEDLISAYGGIHIEPILFSKSKINLSFPLLVGFGGVGYIDGDREFDEDIDSDNRKWDAIFVAEPGISILYNLSRFVQLEGGVKYRLSSRFDIYPDGINRINGFSAGLGIKIGVFNLGKNRYEKKAPDEKQN